MITLYQFASSPFTDKVRRAFNYKNVPFEVHEVDRMGVDKLTHVSPFGKFPAIQDGQQAVCDSTDIILHLASRFPENPLIPSDPKLAALAHMIEDWADESLYHYEITMRISWEHNAKRTVAAIMPTMPAGMPEAQVLQMMLANSKPLSEAQGLGRKAREQVVADALRHAKALDAMLEGNDFLVGDSLSIADISVLPQVRCLMFAEEFLPAVEASQNIKSWMERIDSLAPATL